MTAGRDLKTTPARLSFPTLQLSFCEAQEQVQPGLRGKSKAAQRRSVALSFFPWPGYNLKKLNSKLVLPCRRPRATTRRTAANVSPAVYWLVNLRAGRDRRVSCRSNHAAGHDPPPPTDRWPVRGQHQRKASPAGRPGLIRVRSSIFGFSTKKG